MEGDKQDFIDYSLDLYKSSDWRVESQYSQFFGLDRIDVDKATDILAKDVAKFTEYLQHSYGLG